VAQVAIAATDWVVWRTVAPWTRKILFVNLLRHQNHPTRGDLVPIVVQGEVRHSVGIRVFHMAERALNAKRPGELAHFGR
jgi:hypothetical protein